MNMYIIVLFFTAFHVLSGMDTDSLLITPLETLNDNLLTLKNRLNTHLNSQRLPSILNTIISEYGRSTNPDNAMTEIIKKYGKMLIDGVKAYTEKTKILDLSGNELMIDMMT